MPVFISKVGSEASADACLKGDVGERATKLCKVGARHSECECGWFG